VNIRSPIIGEEDGKFSPAAGQQEQSLDGNWKRGYGFRPPGMKSNSMVEGQLRREKLLYHLGVSINVPMHMTS